MNNDYGKYPWIDEFCLAMVGAEKDFSVDWGATRYLIRSKIFAMVTTDKEGRSIASLKLVPENGLMAREQFKDIIPGYYMNKDHWNSIYLEGDVPDDTLKEMLTEAHGLILKSFSKKAQVEIMG